MSTARTRTIRVDALARVEGEGALTVKLHDGVATDVQLRIFEPPRFFEAFLRGRHFLEAPDLTARICGICPVAYQMSAVSAMEDACGVTVPAPLRDLRRLLYCGEWIESHALHICLLHAPDFLGFEDAFQMAAKYPDIVEQGLQLKKVGNEIVALLGGREVHPINVRVGGFHYLPPLQKWASIVERLKWARDAARVLVRWTATLPFPDFEQEYEFVALRHPAEYPMLGERLASNCGLDIAVCDFEQHFREEHVAYSTALHAVHIDQSHAHDRGDGSYSVGPLARYALNYDRLSPLAQEAAAEAGLAPVCRNPFQSIVVRSVETLHACDEALRILGNLDMPDRPAVAVEPRAATGYGCSEAPRGILYHRYRLDEAGMILDASIVPPTAQNQKTIERDLRHYVQARMHLPEQQLTWQCEQAIRNYDPCISCSTHFLRLDLQEA